MSGIAIRRAVPKDCAAVEKIVQRAYAHYVARIGRPPAPMVANYTAQIAEGLTYVAESDGIVRGLLVLIAEPDALMIENVAVDPAAQGAGIGRALLVFAETEARRAGYRFIKLYTNAAMTENIALYEHLGYAETHRSEEKAFRRVHMQKPLA